MESDLASMKSAQGGRPSDYDAKIMKQLDANGDGRISDAELDMLNKEVGGGGLLRILSLLQKLMGGRPNAEMSGGASAMMDQSGPTPSQGTGAEVAQPIMDNRAIENSLAVQQAAARQKLLGGGM